MKMRFLTVVEVAKETLQKRWEELSAVEQNILLAILVQKDAIPGISDYFRALPPNFPFGVPLKSVFVGLCCTWAFVHGVFAVGRYIARRVEDHENSYFIYSVLAISAFVLAFVLPKLFLVFLP
jgi:hypothetical protein